MVGWIHADEDAPRVARDLTALVLDRLDGTADGRGDDVALAVSELVANAVVHGPPGHVTVRLAASDQTLRVEVADEGLEPFAWGDGFRSEGHWGLPLVREISDRFGVDRDPHTIAWCEFDLL